VAGQIVSTEGSQMKLGDIDILGDMVLFFKKHELLSIGIVLSVISIITFAFFFINGLGLAYNDARSHLDISRRVVEGLRTGLAQLGSVWLPLPHFLTVFTVWNDFMWHSGLSGALVSMISYVGSGIYIYLSLKRLGVSYLARIAGVLAYATNANVLYLQSTAMTELLLILTITAAVYELIAWYKNDTIWSLIKASFWIMLSTLTRYEGWFLFIVAIFVITLHTFFTKGYRTAEGIFIFVASLAGFGIALWFLWNLLIFKDPLYFALGPYSAHVQQSQIYEAGDLATKWNFLFSAKVYLYGVLYNSGVYLGVLSVGGLLFLLVDKTLNKITKFSLLSILISPLLFNILALYLGFSTMSVVGLTGDRWFNIRYGIMMITPMAILSGYLLHKSSRLRYLLFVLLIVTTFYSYGQGIVTVEDAKKGASAKNVSLVGDWLAKNAKNNNDRVFVSVASHDAIIFSSGLRMSRFIHEGTGGYWESAGRNPEVWARYIVMRTYDLNDSSFSLLKDNPGLGKYDLVLRGEFADVYELREEYQGGLMRKTSKQYTSTDMSSADKNQLLLGSDEVDNKASSSSGLLIFLIFILSGMGLYFLNELGRNPIGAVKQQKITSDFGLSLFLARENIKRNI